MFCGKNAAGCRAGKCGRYATSLLTKNDATVAEKRRLSLPFSLCFVVLSLSCHIFLSSQSSHLRPSSDDPSLLPLSIVHHALYPGCLRPRRPHLLFPKVECVVNKTFIPAGGGHGGEYINAAACCPGDPSTLASCPIFPGAHAGPICICVHTAPEQPGSSFPQRVVIDVYNLALTHAPKEAAAPSPISLFPRLLIAGVIWDCLHPPFSSPSLPRLFIFALLTTVAISR